MLTRAAPDPRRSGLRASAQFGQLLQVMAAAEEEAAPGFSWASVTSMVTYCLGSIDLSPEYLQMLDATGAPQPPQPLDKLGPGERARACPRPPAAPCRRHRTARRRCAC